MGLVESHSISDFIATPTAQEQLQLDAMFMDLFWNHSRESALVMVVKLIHCIANGTAVKWLRQGVTQNAYYNTLKSFDLTTSTLDAKRLHEVKFDATHTDGWGMTCLSHWAAQSDYHAPKYVSESFQLLKRSGGVTFQAAYVGMQMSHNAYYCALLSDRMDWVNCLLSEPALNQGWNLPCEEYPTPLFIILRRAESVSAISEEMGRSIIVVMSDEAINMPDEYGSTLLYLALCRPIGSVLETLLSRPGLNMNPSMRTVRSALRKPNGLSSPLDLQKPGGLSSSLDLQKPGGLSSSLDLQKPNGLSSPLDSQNVSATRQTSVVAAFDTVARRFDIVPLWIQESVQNGFQITLPIPLCTIIYHYYRMPYPICECNPALLAAAPTKHSPFCFCFPP